jgi:hypothetical protein
MYPHRRKSRDHRHRLHLRVKHIRLRNKKLKNLLQCVTRQTFIRKSFAFDLEPEIDAVVATRCTAMSDPVVISFLAQWSTGDNSQLFGGEFRKEKGSDRMVWSPKDTGDGKLLVSALQVQHFLVL